MVSTGILDALLDPTADLENLRGVRTALGLEPLPPDARYLVVSGTGEELMKAGQYPCIDLEIREGRIPIGDHRGKFEFELCRFRSDVTSDQVLKAIADSDYRFPWRAGSLEHLLAFGEQYPDEQFKYPIAALGSWSKGPGFRRVAVLDNLQSQRYLRIGFWFGAWCASARYRFLKVRKPRQPLALNP